MAMSILMFDMIKQLGNSFIHLKFGWEKFESCFCKVSTNLNDGQLLNNVNRECGVKTLHEQRAENLLMQWQNIVDDY